MVALKTQTEEAFPQAWRCETEEDVSLAVLLVRLRGADRELRGRTAYQLRERGRDAVHALCEALDDPDPAVRSAVVESLAEIGDARAIPPLTEALKRCIDARASRKQRLLVLAALTFVVVMIGLFVFRLFTLKQMSGIGGGWVAFIYAYNFISRSRHQRGPQIVTLASAIERIASREPTPELRTLLPELQSVARDPLLHTASTRSATKEVADRIAALTERIKSMPVIAEAPPTDADQLPIAVAPR